MSEDWQASSAQGPVRLAALTADMRYINQGARRAITAELSPVDYDGPLPGGYAAGLSTQGVLDVNLAGEGLETTFQPIGPIRFGRFQTVSGWTASDAQFSLMSKTPFFRRENQAGEGALTARLESAAALLTEEATGRQLRAVIGAVDIDAAITGMQQDWALDLFDTDIQTDDFGGPGTIAGAEIAALRAVLSPGAAPQIDLRSDAARVKTDQITTQDMKVALIGTPTAFHLDFGGQDYASAGQVKFADETLPQLPLRGELDYLDGQITGRAMTVLPEAEDTDIDIVFRLKDGAGTAKIEIPNLTFMPRGLQPQNLVPALQGKIAKVAGTVVDSFNPGVDLIDGVIEYELVDQGVNILSAKWPLANGFISVDPAIWRYDAPENRVVLRIEDVSVGAFLGGSGGSALTVTGDVVGVIPVVIAGVDVRIEKGSLGIENGGVIQYRAQELTSVVDLIPENYVTLQDYQQFRTIQKSEDPNENAGKDLAFTALRNFEYKSLAVKLDGPLDGDIELNVRFIGRNPKILAGTEFDFNVTIVGELVNLVRSLKPDSSLERIRGYIELDAPDAAGISP